MFLLSLLKHVGLDLMHPHVFRVGSAGFGSCQSPRYFLPNGPSPSLGFQPPAQQAGCDALLPNGIVCATAYPPGTTALLLNTEALSVIEIKLWLWRKRNLRFLRPSQNPLSSALREF
ncbi:hypothetical protein CesoFtcFv8_001537 [Champsocephalus esox]|uniref:Uncharacterized protein n=1 Tax=Champsocephalus esox TaxID=159716 RepID=A0AAN8HH02_9TELE|nr:hypothetical protein CesoFtcFv8_001537 [Champsocephalus esox]